MTGTETSENGPSGLELIEGMRDGVIPAPGISTLIGMTLVEVERGRCVFAVEPGPQHGNPIGTTHGGIHATLLDSCMGCAIHTQLEAGDTYTTLELSVNYLRPVLAGSGQMVATGTAIHVGGRVATAEGRIHTADGKLVAHGTTTCLVMRGAGS